MHIEKKNKEQITLSHIFSFAGIGHHVSIVLVLPSGVKCLKFSTNNYSNVKPSL